MKLAVLCQVLLLGYHQLTTLVDLYPFNGVRNYSRRERWAESGINAVLMSLAPLGFVFHLHWLMLFGAIYYPLLLGLEITIWWVPYFAVPSGRSRTLYNHVLALATSDFGKGDTLQRWITIHRRLHEGTLTVLPVRSGGVTPNLEHMILHGWTFVTAVATLVAYRATRM